MKNFRTLLLLALLSLTPDICSAGATDLPWETPLQRIVDSLSGPVAKILATIAIIASGIVSV